MLDDRRLDERAPSFEIIRVTAKTPDGAEWTFPVMLRDRSPQGLGGVYVGPNPPGPDLDCYLEEADGELRRVRVAWINALANHVFVLGLRLCGD